MRLARLVGVRLGPEGRDLVDPLTARGVVANLGADRAELLALGPDRVRPALEAPLDLGRTGVGGQVEIEVVAPRPDEQVADRAANEVQAMAGLAESCSERGQLVQHGQQTFGNHGAKARRGDSMS